MKIVLVFPPFYLEPMYNLPPLGLVNIATALQAPGSAHQTTIIDFPLAIRRNTLRMGKSIYDDCANIIMSHAPDLVGFSVQCTTYPAAITIARKVKEINSGIRTVFGGHNASFTDERTLESYSWIDAVVRGEAELTFPELVAAYEGGADVESIPGLTHRKEGKTVRNPDRELIRNLDDLPLADYSLLPPLSEYRDTCKIRRSIAILEVGRGCPHQCVYCSQSIMWRRQTRVFSVDRLIREMRHLGDRFGAECFLLAYDQFTARRSFVEEYCRKVIDSGLNRFPWYCISRLDSVDTKLLHLMREAGCESMCYGIDSGSKRTLNFIHKNIDHGILYQKVMETTDVGVVPTLSFVIGFPEEEKEDIDATLTLALRTGVIGNSNPLIQLATILPGTELHRHYANRLIREVDTYFSLGIEFDNGKRLDSDEKMINSDPILFSSFYNLPCPGAGLKQLNTIANTFPLIVNFYPRSFLLLSMELGMSVSDLFFTWVEWVCKQLGRTEAIFSPRECYEHFELFALEMFGNAGKKVLRHFPEILRYETLALEAGKFEWSESQNSFHIDMSRIDGFRPFRSQKIVFGQFTFCIPDLILDLKAGIYKETYTPEDTFLVFRHENNTLDVRELNEFGRDFLQLCDGKRALQDIARELYNRYGAEDRIDHAKFFNYCVEAVQLLGEMRLLQCDVERLKSDREGR